MDKFGIDFSGIAKMMDNNHLPVQGNEHRMIRVAFDLFRLKGDEAEDLWQVQSADDGDFLVRTYSLPDDEIEVESDWSVMADKKCAHFTITYKNVPIKRIDAADHGAETPEDGKVLQGVIFRKLASDAKFVEALIGSLPKEKKDVLQSIFGMYEDEQDAGDYTPEQKQKVEQWKTMSHDDKSSVIPGYDKMLLADLLPQILAMPLIVPGEAKVYPTPSQTKYMRQQELKKQQPNELAKKWTEQVKTKKEDATINLDIGDDPLGGIDMGGKPGDLADDPVLAALEAKLTNKTR